ncbi:MAG: P-loop NTPase fold protein [Pseudomonadota bacterium]
MTTEQLKTSEPEDFWIGDILKRKEAAQYLEKYLTTRYSLKKDEEGFVLAVNAEWGYGKTFMLERWKKELSFKRYPVVYFDAWKNDFTTDPLIAFIAELDSGLAESFAHVPIGKKLYATAFGKLKKIIKPATQVLISAGAKHLAGMSVEKATQIFIDNDDAETSVGADKKESKGQSFENTKKSLEQAVNNALKEHKNTKTAIKEFKEKLTLLIEALNENALVQLPVFIFVDELDRCRPDYAIELLEGIKHLFGVKGIYFVVATNIAQLSESVKAVYGAGFDGERYLKRFFDLEYILPEPSNFTYAKYLLSKAITPKHFMLNLGYTELDEHVEPDDCLAYIFSKYASYFKLGLRDQLQSIKILEAAFVHLNPQKIQIHLLLFFALLYQKSSRAFESVVHTNSLSVPEYTEFKFSQNSCTFDHSFYNDSGQRENRKTSINEIGNIYLNLRMTHDATSFNIQAKQGFPHNQGLKLMSMQTPQERPWEYNINLYIDIVKHAGGFIEKN